MPTAGAISLVHIVGITPEAPTVEEALGHKKPLDTISVSYKNLQSSYEKLTTTRGGDVDVVTFGCPHCTIQQIREIASLLDGEKVNSNTPVGIHVSASQKDGTRHGLCRRHREVGGLGHRGCLCFSGGVYFILLKE